MDAAGVVILTLDILPDFNDYRAQSQANALSREVEQLVRSGIDANRSEDADGLPKGYPTRPVEYYDSAIAGRYMAAATIPLDLERLQRMVRKMEAAKDPLAFLGERRPPPIDLAGVHARLRTMTDRLNEISIGPGSRWRFPLYWAILLLLVGFVFQLIGTIPDGRFWRC